MKNWILASFNTPNTNQGFSDATYSLSAPLVLINLIIKEIIKHFFNRFIKPNSKYFLLVRFKYASGSIRTLHKGIVVSSLSSDAYLRYIESVLTLKSNYYHSEPVIEVTFNFFLIAQDREKYYTDKWSALSLVRARPIKLDKFEFFQGGSYYLPPNQDYTKWGLVLSSSNLENTLVITDSNNTIYKVNKLSNLTFKVEVIKGQLTILTFIDSHFQDDIFIRKIDKFTYYIQNGKILLKVKELQTEYLTKLANPKDLSPNPKIITFDLETVTSASDGIMTPFLASMFDGKDKFYWFTDDPSYLFKELLRSKYYGYSVYAHNLSRFDLVFLFKYIASLAHEGEYSVDIKKDDQVKLIRISNNHKKISITLKDSYLLLPDTLANLAILFLNTNNTGTGKTIEPVFSSEEILARPFTLII